MSTLTFIRLHWTCSMTLGRPPNALLVSLLLEERKVRQTRQETLGASPSSSTQRKVIGIGYSTIRLYSSYAILRNSPSSSIPRSVTHRPISKMRQCEWEILPQDSPSIHPVQVLGLPVHSPRVRPPGHASLLRPWYSILISPHERLFRSHLQANQA